MNSFNRRSFLGLLSAVPLAGLFYACKDKTNPNIPKQSGQLQKDQNAMELSRSLSREQLHAMLDQRVNLVMEKSHNCAQSSFYALSEQFGLGGDDVLKALTPLPGMAERGDTCGAMTGALMALGLIYGREDLSDWQKYRQSLEPTNRFCRQFEADLGSSKCHKIQECAFGRHYDLMQSDELKAFQKADATSRCTKVVQKACRLAADIIVESVWKG
jgi:C_GCAxxG_C_C family probable redox protein